MARNVRGLVFDLDGTLVDSYAAIAEALNAARAAFGLPALDEGRVRGLVGHGLEALLADQLGPERVAEGVRTFRERYERVGVARTTALAGVPAGLHALACHGYRMAVATNKPARFAEPILAALGLARYFLHVAGPDVVGVTKPDPAVVSACLRALELAPADAAYVGDMVLDVETADRAGLPVVLVCGGSSPEVELRATGRPVVRSFHEVVALFLPHVPGELTSDRGAPTPS